jgi:tetratricopeptide (TPR) repeat protein
VVRQKTRPAWYKEFSKVLARAQQENDAINYLSVAWQYYFVGLDRLCEKTLDKVQELDSQLMDVWLLRGYIHQSKGRFESAILCFKEITDNSCPDKILTARAWMACGHCQAQQIENSRTTKPDWHEVLKSYKQAALTDSSLADPHYYLGVTLIKAELLKDAEAELLLCQNNQRAGKEALTWLDPVLGSMVQQEINAIRSITRSKQ